jgi:hypothetical protein
MPRPGLCDGLPDADAKGAREEDVHDTDHRRDGTAGASALIACTLQLLCLLFLWLRFFAWGQGEAIIVYMTPIANSQACGYEQVAHALTSAPACP